MRREVNEWKEASEKTRKVEFVDFSLSEILIGGHLLPVGRDVFRLEDVYYYYDDEDTNFLIEKVYARIVDSDEELEIVFAESEAPTIEEAKGLTAKQLIDRAWKKCHIRAL